MDKTKNEFAKLEEAKQHVIGAIAETMDLYGVAPSAGSLYATMYFKDKMTLDEMREELEMSKPSMSTGVRKLQEIEMVKKTFPKGTRKHTYVAEKDFFRSFMVFYCQMWERESKMNMEAIEAAQEEFDQIIKDPTVSEEVVNQAKEHYQLVENSKDYYRWLESLADSIRSGKIFDFLPKK
ncbi:GbsR/MarR family transcriptional regulator [Aquibacillus halophilus]|uniref:HTH-type transcriptional regulator n=1 Tax=Aquibacillus halophilus TaxID=930132 RepID=A0A6A8DL61_9BACI|nr:GbsR/MarR family transcriptional regulator [Aquibacillus halophilus]MRH43727.1 GbsR/MarR family transcriptional regulator [Aquibacillus halophilus]